MPGRRPLPDLFPDPDGSPQPFSPVRRRLLDAAGEIAAGAAEELGFLHTVMCQTYMPARRPPPGTYRWSRRQGRASLLVVAGEVLDPRTREYVQLSLPFGPAARLLLMHLNGEA